MYTLIKDVIHIQYLLQCIAMYNTVIRKLVMARVYRYQKLGQNTLTQLKFKNFIFLLV